MFLLGFTAAEEKNAATSIRSDAKEKTERLSEAVIPK